MCFVSAMGLTLLTLQFFELLLLQCSQQAVFQASASEAADFLRAPQPCFFGSAARVASELRSRGPSLKNTAVVAAVFQAAAPVPTQASPAQPVEVLTGG